ncbi:MAG: ABC transporter permease subunit [Alphaproteobacteria bacterium]|jgi:peptide/nickel transport system permease protein|nr:ABC transporter permease subunit [Alphaproteobacteria bacterium]
MAEGSARLGLAGISVAAIAIAVAVGPELAPHGRGEIVGGIWERPSAKSWLGTDQLGRDLLARLLHAGRTTLLLSGAGAFLGWLIGCVGGICAALAPRWLDQVLARTVDGALAVPPLLLGLLVLTILPPAPAILVTVLVVVEAPRVFRTVRALSGTVVSLDYITAARLRGEGFAWLVFGEIFPVLRRPLAAELGLRVAYTILLLSALSFLGLGVQSPDTDWGSMVRENAQGLFLGVGASLYPAAAIACVTLSLNFLISGDSLRA